MQTYNYHFSFTNISAIIFIKKVHSIDTVHFKSYS